MKENGNTAACFCLNFFSFNVFSTQLCYTVKKGSEKESKVEAEGENEADL